MIMVIIILHVMTAIDFAFSWSYIHFIYIKHGQTFVDEFEADYGLINLLISIAITGIVSTICADSAMVL